MTPAAGTGTGSLSSPGTARLTKLVNQGEQTRLGQAVRVLECLAGPAGAPVLLPVLAAGVTGDTKALNPGTVLSTLVLRRAGRQGRGGQARHGRRAAGSVGGVRRRRR